MINEIFAIIQNLTTYVQAQTEVADQVKDLPGALTVFANGLKTLILALRNVVIALGFLFVIVGGIKFATGQGDPEKVNEGKQTILWAIVAMLGATAFWVILKLILGSILGVEGIEGGGVNFDVTDPNF